MIIAYPDHEPDQRCLAAHGKRERVQLFTEYDTAIAHWLAELGRLAVIGIDRWLSGRTRELALILAERKPTVPVLLRFDLRPLVLAELPRLAALPVDLRASYREYDDLGARLQTSGPDLPHNATVIVLRAIGPLLRQDIAKIVVALLVLGERRVAEDDACGRLGLTAKSVRLLLQASGLGSLRGLLAQFLCVHAFYRVSRLGWTVKAAALDAGFGDPKAFEEFARRNCGMRPAAIQSAGGFEYLLRKLEDRLRA